MRIVLIVIFQVLAVVSIAVVDPSSSYSQSVSDISRHTDRMGWFSWVGMGDVGTFDAAEVLVIESLHEGRVEYEISQMTFVPLVFPTVVNEKGENERVVYYNFRGLANGLAWGLSSVFAGAGFSEVEEIFDSHWPYVLFAPNCRARVRLSGDLKLVLGTRTDYVLYRTVNSDRGIVFTPHVGLSRTTGEFGEGDYSGFSVSVGYRKMWNFDGESSSGELALFVSLWGAAGV